jgi:hypothetical protein
VNDRDNERAGQTRLPAPEALADLLSASGSRPAPYWPGPPPEGWAPGAGTRLDYAERLEHQRQTGGPNPRAAAWRAYGQEQRACWERRMRLVEQVARAQQRGAWPPKEATESR